MKELGKVRDEMGFRLLGYVVMPEHVARFYDFNVYSEGKRKEKLNYMHANPVIRGLVKHPRDWRWSSWGFYYERVGELIAIDAE